jgi:hypothetical protein
MNIISKYFSVVNKKLEEIMEEAEKNQLKELLSEFERQTGFSQDIALIEYNEAKEEFLLEKKFENLPQCLMDDIEYTVKKSYFDDFSLYLDDVSIFFKTFTKRDLRLIDREDQIEVLADLLEKMANIYNRTAKEKISSDRILKQIKNQRRKLMFHASVLLKLVGKTGKNYCSNTVFSQYKMAKIKEQQYIKDNVLVGKDGYIVSLAKATKTVDQNIAEKLNIINTMEKMAKDNEFTWSFITVTLAPEFHPNPSKGVSSYNGVSPAESAKMLNSNINKTRALMKKRGLKPGQDFFGTTTAEAHKDGCLHKHILMFHHPDKTNEIQDCFFSVFPNLKKQVLEAMRLESEGLKSRNPWQIDEDFDSDDNWQVERKEGERAKASSYVFKYVMKSLTAFDPNLDIASIDEKKEEDKLIYSSMLNNCFRSYNSIRGVTFFGLENCLSKFRFLARNTKKVKMHARLEEVIKSNDLYAFIKERHCDDVSNKYVEVRDIKKFVGCVVSGVSYLKNFFAMAKRKSALANKSLFVELANISFNEVMVLVNHNCSRELQNTAQSALSPPV